MSGASQFVFNKLLKPSCIHCKFFNPVITATVDCTGADVNLLQSTCKKFLVSPMQHTYFDKTEMAKHEFREKQPYAISARLDITMCGLNGGFFSKK
jgi:hypothetical protein